MSATAPYPPDFIAAQAARLHQRRVELAAQLDARLHGQGAERSDTAGLPRRADDTDDDAAAETARAADLDTLARLARELDAVDAALARVAERRYGACGDCGEPIAAARLSAQPTALRCADCQAVDEQRHARSASRPARPGGG